MWRCRRASMTLELAFVLPVLLLAMMGLWDFGRALQEKYRLVNAARAGLQFGMRDPIAAADTAGIARAVRTDAADTANALSVSSQRNCDCPNGTVIACNASCTGGAQPLTYLQINVGAAFNPTFPYPMITRPYPLSYQIKGRIQ